MSLADKLKLSIGSKEVNLPSKGLLGNPVQVTVRPFLTKDEKYIATIDSADPEPALAALVNSLVISEGFSIDKCVVPDFVAILLAAHVLTYGNTIKTSTICDSCENIDDYVVDAADLGINAEREFNTTLTFQFPISKLTITYHILQYDEIAKINAFMKAGSKLLNRKTDSIDINIRKAARMIDTVKNEQGETVILTTEEKEELLKSTLLKADVDEWMSHISKNSIDDKFDFTHKCSNCGFEGKHRLLVGYDFFFSKTQEVLSAPSTIF